MRPGNADAAVVTTTALVMYCESRHAAGSVEDTLSYRVPGDRRMSPGDVGRDDRGLRGGGRRGTMHVRR